MKKALLLLPFWALLMLAHVSEGAEHDKSSRSILLNLLSLGEALQGAEMDSVIQEYRDALLGDVSSTIEVILDQAYQRKAKADEILAVFKLIPELDSDDFASREAAEERLITLGLPVDLLLESLMDQASPESVVRLTKVRK